MTSRYVLSIVFCFVLLGCFGCVQPEATPSARSIQPRPVEPIWQMPTQTARDYFAWVAGQDAPDTVTARHLGNFFSKLQRGEDVTIAFLGGSITWGGSADPVDTYCYRAMVTKWLQARYPASTITSINAGMGGTPSRLGAFRTDVQVLSHEADLCIVEFCCNDGRYNRPEYGDQITENMEAIVRKCLEARCDVVVFCVATPNPNMVYDQHLKVAGYYGVPFVDLQSWVHEMIDAGRFSYDPDFADGKRNVHPNNFGHSIYAERIARAMMQHENLPACTPKPLEAPLTENRLERATMVPFSERNVLDWGGFRFEPTHMYGPWKGNISTTRPYEAVWPFPYRSGIVRATEPGATIKVRFRGRVFGTWGPGAVDGGIVKVTIDGKEVGKKSMYWKWGDPPMGPSGWTVYTMDLAPGEHVAELTVTQEKPKNSKGHRVELGYLLVEE